MIQQFHIRMATSNDQTAIWNILQQAIQRRKMEGSNQWQDGYPNPAVVLNDIIKQQGFVLTINNTIKAYIAIIINDEPAYQHIQGQWKSNRDFIVIHRVAVADDSIGQNMSFQLFQWAEQYAIIKNIFSIKVDTNFDNMPMLHILQKLNYQYCGEVHFRGSPRKAFEKLLR